MKVCRDVKRQRFRAVEKMRTIGQSFVTNHLILAKTERTSVAGKRLQHHVFVAFRSG